MELEAVWLKDEEELWCITPVLEFTHNGTDIDSIEVYNGWSYYKSVDIMQFTGKKPNGFIVRERKDDGT